MDDKIRIVIETNASDAADTFEKMANSLKDNAVQSDDLRKQIKDLKNELYSLEQGSEEYNAVLSELSQKMHDFKDINEEVKNSSGELDVVFGNLQQVTTGVAAGFSTVQATFALFGSKSENLQKTMVKLQAAMAIVQGLKGMEGFAKKAKALGVSLSEYIKQTKLARTATQGLTSSEVAATTATNGLSASMKGLKTALISTGIGALIVLLGGLINMLTKVKEKTDTATSSTAAAMGAIIWDTKTLSDAFSQQDAELERNINILKANGATEEEIYNKRHDLILDQIESNKDYGGSLTDLAEAFKTYSGTFEQFVEENTFLSDRNISSLDELNTAIKENYEQFITLENKLKNIENGYAVDVINAEKEKTKAAKKSAEDRIAAEKKVAEETKKLLDKVVDSYKKEMQNIVKEYDSFVGIIQKLNSTTADTFGSTKEFDELINKWNALNLVTDEEASSLAKVNTVQIQLYNQSKQILEKYTKELTDQYNYEKKVIEETPITAEYTANMKKTALNTLKSSFDTSLKTLGKEAEETAKYIQDRLIIGLGNMHGAIEEETGNWIEAGSILLNSSMMDLDKTVKKFVDNINTIKRLYDNNLMSTKEYYDKLFELYSGFNKNKDQALSDYDAFLQEEMDEQLSIERAYLDTLMEDGEITMDEYAEMFQNKFNELSQIYEKDSAVAKFMSMIPKEVMSNISNDISSSIEAMLEKVESESERVQFILSQNLRTNEQPVNFMERIFGLDKAKLHSLTLDYINDMYEALKSANTQKQEILQEQLSMLDESSDAYKEYYSQLIELQREWAQLTNEQYDSVREANKGHIDDMIENMNTLMSATNSFASGMSSLYEVMAGNYDEDSKEYKDYMKKSGQYKKAGIWMSAAQGIMSVWGTAMELGPIVGPVMAALETAGLLLTATAQSKQIDQQLSKIGTSAGGSSSINTGGVDRVIYGNYISDDTNSWLQNNRSSDTRVYVLQSDITDTQNKVRVTESNVTF